MPFDPAMSLRIINNERLRRAQGWVAYRDLGGALVLTSDAPIIDFNCLEAFATDDHHVESLLDVGFSLLRAFDREPAVHVTPLDRPASLAERLGRRGLLPVDRWSAMAFTGDADHIAVNGQIDVQVAGPDDARTFANIQSAGDDAWMRRMSLSGALSGMHDPGNTLYLAYTEGQAVGTTHLICDEATAGIYAVGTLRGHRRRGVATALIVRALRDARAAGCDVIGLRTLAGSDAERLYARIGFAPVHESVLWTAPEAPVEPPTKRRVRRRRGDLSP
jgi:GNAT superfamily N-acetyltransferase